MLHRSPLWREREDLLRSVPGVGPVLALTLLADLPELATLAPKQLAALVGVAPLNRDSGAHTGKRLIWGGGHGALGALYGDLERDTLQLRARGVLDPPAGARQTHEGGVGGLHA